MISEQKLMFWIEKGYNVLFSGAHGVGKSSVVIEVFKKARLKWAYFSGATMDPFIDFVGVPVKVDDEDGSHIKLILPEHIRPNEIEAIFIDEYNRCLSGDTKISLLDGRSVPIKELESEPEFFVYSFDSKSGKIVAGRGHSCRKTGVRQKMVEVELDNGESVKCTPDHPFLLSNGDYVLAFNLRAGDILMSLYRRLSECVKKNKYVMEGYEEVYQPLDDVWEYTHVLSDDYNLRVGKYRNFKGRMNHTVISVKESENEDVYDITVDDYHNFAIESGVFVHNSHKKVRNATMELIQFRSINGRPFPNLKLIWAAINPDNEADDLPSYDVETMDPAQRDRFHVHVTIPYKPIPSYFTSKYGDEIGKAGLQWWDELPDKAKEEVSPRRLDYALQMFQDGGDIHDVLPRISNPALLKLLLHTGPAEEKLDNFMKNKDETGAKSWLAADNNFEYVKTTIFKFAKYRRWFVPLMLTERVSQYMASDARLKWEILDDMIKKGVSSAYIDMLREIVQSDVDAKLCEDIRKKMEAAGLDVPAIKAIPVYQTGSPPADFSDRLGKLATYSTSSARTKTYQRRAMYQRLLKLVPPSMTAAQAWQVLDICNGIIGPSYHHTIDKFFPKVIAISNAAIIQLIEHREPLKNIEDRLSVLKRIRLLRKRKCAPGLTDIVRYCKSRKQAP